MRGLCDAHGTGAKADLVAPRVIDALLCGNDPGNIGRADRDADSLTRSKNAGARIL